MATVVVLLPEDGSIKRLHELQGNGDLAVSMSFLPGSSYIGMGIAKDDDPHVALRQAAAAVSEES